MANQYSKFDGSRTDIPVNGDIDMGRQSIAIISIKPRSHKPWTHADREKAQFAMGFAGGMITMLLVFAFWKSHG